MTKETQELVDRELNAALESGDTKLIDRAVVNAQKAVADCRLLRGEVRGDRDDRLGEPTAFADFEAGGRGVRRLNAKHNAKEHGK